jgi:hypothetical protein
MSPLAHAARVSHYHYFARRRIEYAVENLKGGIHMRQGSSAGSALLRSPSAGAQERAKFPFPFLGCRVILMNCLKKEYVQNF